MNNNYKEFQKLVRRIPNELFLKKKIIFIPVRENKLPERGGSWKNDERIWMSVRDATNRLRAGKNVAIVAISGGLMYLDLDTEKTQLKASSSFLWALPNTLTSVTPSGGLHKYFLNDGYWDNQKYGIRNSEGKIEPGKEWGELRTNWQYVLCPGSSIENKQYKVINDVSISSFSNILNMFKKRETKIIDGMREKKKHEDIEDKGKEKKEEHMKKMIESGKGRRKMSRERIEQILEELSWGVR